MNFSRRSLVLAGATALGGVAMSGRAWASAPAALRDVQVAVQGEAVRLQLGLDRPVAANSFFLAGPNRFVVDLASTQIQLQGGRSSGEGPGAGVVERYRFAQREGGVARLVFDLAAPTRLQRQELGRGSAGLSFDLAATVPIIAPARPLEIPGRSGPRRTIVIDAGHGGHDPGAIGVTGVREKDVVLDSALLLRDALESRGRYRVALTRDADRFVPLENRVDFARGQNADLFISLHADSNANREAAGASVYTLSERGAARAQGMMNAQNWDIDVGDAPRGGLIGNILVDLAQRETTNRSAEFAETVISGLGGVSPLLRNTHRNAGFFVLLAPDVPAVLIETGFLSNAADERRLSSPRERQNMAESMAGSVDNFFAGPAMMASR